MNRDLLAAAFVAGAALVPRVWILTATSASGLMADMVDYFDRARHLFEHGRLYPDAFRVPAYPVAISGAFEVFGPTTQSARVLQCLILTLVAVATFELARRSMGRTRAVVAGLIVAWYPGLLLYTVYVMAEPLFMLLVLVAMLCARNFSLAAMAGAGLAAGAATMTRQTGLSVALAVVAWAAFRPATVGWRPTRSRRAALAAVAAAGVVIALAPWTLRNYREFGRWMPLETTGGITFLMAHYENATGRYLLSDWDAVHARHLRGQPEEFSRNSAAYRMGLDYIRRDPLRILRLVPRRLGYLFDLEGREHLWLYTSGYFGPRARELVLGAGWAIVMSFPLLVTAAIVSLGFGPRPQTVTDALIVWVLAVMTVQLLTVFGDPRFHLPLVPLLALVAVRPWPRDRPPRSGWRTLAAVSALTLALWWWGSRLPAQITAIERAAAPDGWQTPRPY